MERTKKDGRKVLLMLPLLVLPFLALGFYALGGGKGTAQQKDSTVSGINSELPDASIAKDEKTDKLSVYQKADRDSVGSTGNAVESVANRLGFNGLPEDAKTKEINEKLTLLNKEISSPSPPLRSTGSVAVRENGSMKSDVDRLEQLMKTMKAGSGEDPEMAQLNEMLQKIIDIQNPEQVAQRNRELLKKQPADSLFLAIPAVIANDQRAVQGATIKLRLSDTLRFRDILLPKGHELFGTCNIANQRLLLTIKNIRLGNSIIPAELVVYSLDGMAGIYAPEALLSEAAGSGAVDAMGGFGITGFDLTSQLAGAGLDAAKGLLAKKVRRVKVKLKAGYPVLLRNNQNIR